MKILEVSLTNQRSPQVKILEVSLTNQRSPLVKILEVSLIKKMILKMNWIISTSFCVKKWYFHCPRGKIIDWGMRSYFFPTNQRAFYISKKLNLTCFLYIYLFIYLGGSPINILDLDVPANHLEFSQIIPFFPDLEELKLCYKVTI